MQLTLERWRWLPVDLHAAPIVANIPEFRLRAYDENFKIGLTMNVVVGKAYDHDTPVFIDSMQYVVFRPYWSVPYSIAKAEFFRASLRDPNYLAAKGFEVVDAQAERGGLRARCRRRCSRNCAPANFSSARIRARKIRWAW